MTRTSKILLPAVALLLGTVFIAVAHLRLIDGDEGFYLLSAKLVFHGKVLYRDFFYTQMPMLPFAYGSWMRIAGETWSSARLLSGLLAATLGCLLYCHVTRNTDSWLAGCLAALLFASSTPVVVWFTTVKTYSISTLLLFGAYMAVWEGSGKWTLALSGLLFALSVDCRLYLAGIAPVLLFSINHLRAAYPNRRIAYSWFFGGLALGLSPNLYWIVQDPTNYYFNNLGYHAVRSGAGLVGAYGQKIETLFEVSGLIVSKEANGLPFGFLLLMNSAYFLTQRRPPGPRVWLAMQIAAALILLSVLPTPSFQQYYSVATPFLIVGAVTFAWDSTQPKPRLLALAVVLIMNLSLIPSDLRRYTSTGVGLLVMGPERAMNWQLPTVRAISREVDRQVTPGEFVLSFWPGYLFESHAECFPGMETHVGLSVASKLTAAQLTQYRILSIAGVDAALKRRMPCVVVLGNQESMLVDGAPFDRMLQLRGYRVSYALGHTSIYTCR